MKNFMKKIIVGIFSLALMLVGVNIAQAAGWNQYPGDCPAINIGNYSTGQGINPGSCWNLTNVSATGGQVINVKVFYDNTNGVAANNTNISLTKSPASGASTNFSFSGNLTSSAGNLPFSQVTANISSSETLTFSQARWYQNGSGTPVSFPGGQTGAEAFTGGLSLGTIPNNDWGAIVFSFNISNNGGGGGSNCTISNFTANGSSSATIQSGSSANIVWNTTGCTSVNVSGPNLSSTNTSGSQTVYPTNSVNTYTITATGTNGTQSQTVTVFVNNNNQICAINNFTANGSNTAYISSGNPVNIVWNTTNCTSVYVTGNGMSSSNISGSQTVYPQSSGQYTITASGNNGGTQTQNVYVNVSNTQNNCYINNFTANGSQSTTVQSGGSVNMVWNTTGCTSASISGPNFYTNGLTGSQYIYPTTSGTYTLSAYGYTGGTQSQTVYISVGGNQGSYCTIQSFYASPNSVTSGQPVTLTWTTTGCTSVSISGVGSNLPYSYSQVVYPTTTTTYYLNAYGNNGNPSQSVSVGVTGGPLIYNTACAVTTLATNIGQTSATLNGLVTSGTGVSYFEYGPTVALGSTTPSINSSGNVVSVISGLAQNTFYYYRLVSNCGGSLSYGRTDVFKTLGTTVINNPVRPIIIQGTTVVGTSSPIMLKIEDRYQTISIGDIIDYTVTYKNIGKVVLTNPVVQVVIPRGITLVRSSAGTYSTDTNTLTVPIQDLQPNEEGVIYLQGHVDFLSSYLSQVVTTAILVYTNPNKAQENAIAYVLNDPREIIVNNVNNNLGAAAFFLGFFPTTLLGWLLLILLILLIILVTRRYYRRSTVHVAGPNGATTTTTHY